MVKDAVLVHVWGHAGGKRFCYLSPVLRRITHCELLIYGVDTARLFPLAWPLVSTGQHVMGQASQLLPCAAMCQHVQQGHISDMS